jgi:GDP-4-dehydro-6-deoxy-D-mannose reductase
VWAHFPPVGAIVHLAGKQFVPDSWEDPAAVIRCNLLGTIGALTHARLHGARVVFLSSYLYGDSATLPIPETAPVSATNPYALSKKFAEESCQFFSQHFGVPVVVLRPFNVYGAGQSDRFLIPSILKQVAARREIRVKDLEPKRDYVYVADVVRAIIAAIRHESRFSVFNVGSGVSHSVRQLIDVVQQACGTRLPVQADGDRRRDEVMDTVADISLASRVLGWTPQWTLSAGVADMSRSFARHG